MKIIKNLFIVLLVVTVARVFAFFDDSGKGRDIKTDLVPFGEMPTLSQVTEPTPILRLLTIPKGKERPHAFCTAFVVDVRYAITAAHCINDNGHIARDMFKTSDARGNDTGISVQAIGYDIRTDLGLITGDFSSVRPIRAAFNKDSFDVGQPAKHLVSCGYPRGQAHLVCTTFLATRMSGFSVAGVGHIIPGMSGGPVIDTDTMEVVAVNYAVTEDGLSLVSPIEGMLGMFGLE